MKNNPIKFSAGSFGLILYMDAPTPPSIVIEHAHAGDIEIYGIENLYDLQYIVNRAIQELKESTLKEHPDP